MDNLKVYSDFCTGCGLCHSVKNVEFRLDNSGFYSPQFNSDKELENFLKNICPYSGKQQDRLNHRYSWGKAVSVYNGYATDDSIRYKASSGGAITAICAYLLDTKKVKGIIHIGASDDDPIITKCFCSRSINDLIKNSGSRYYSSSPLYNICDYISDGNSYAFVGKPCDINALKNLISFHPEWSKSIEYYISFFCMGVPSYNANRRLISKMGCDPDSAKSIQYRGNGWPGYTIVQDYNGETYKTEYAYSWGKILGRDLRKMCKFCMDGIGEDADISCGDAWYINEDNNPDFNEHKGRNVIFARTNKGDNIIKESISAGYLKGIKYDDFEKELPIIQKSQLDRRVTMLARIFAMKIMLRKAPHYNLRSLLSLAKKTQCKRLMIVFLGTLKRAFLHKL